MPLPAATGLRQPIHASQLALVITHLIHQFTRSSVGSIPVRFIDVGGDEILSYRDMITSYIRDYSPTGISITVSPIPNRLFVFLVSPIALIFPGLHAALLRIMSDLSGFQPSFSLTGQPRSSFPYNPNSI